MANVFALILVVSTTVTGVLWCMNRYVYAPKQRRCQEIIKLAINKKSKKTILRKINYKLNYIENGASFFPMLAIILVIRSFICEPFKIPSGSMMPTLLIGDFIIVKKFAYNIKEPIFQKTLIEINHPKRGDVVVFKFPKNPKFNYIKRVIGLPGDKISYNSFTKEITIYPNCGYSTVCSSALPIMYSKVKQSDFVQNINGSNGNKSYNKFLQLPKEKIKNNFIRLEERQEIIDNVMHRILILPIVQDQIGMYYHQHSQPLSMWIVPPNHYFVMGDNRDNSADSRYWGFVSKTNLIGKATIIWMSLDKKENNWITGIRMNRIGWIY